MEIRKYIKSLIPAIERKEVVNAITTLKEELNTTVIPICDDFNESFKDHTFKGKMEKKLSRDLRQVVTFTAPSAVFVVNDVVKGLPALLDIMEQHAKRLFSFQFSTFNISFDRANFLQLLDAVTFYIHYHRRFMLELVQEENVAMGKGKPSKWSKGFKLFVEQGFNSYLELTRAFFVTPSEFETRLKTVSNAEISDDTFEMARKTLGVLKTDPFQLERGFVSSTFRPINPLFSLGKRRAELQVKRYRLGKEELAGLQLRLQEYRELRDGSNADPKLQKLIEYTESRVENLNYELVQFEEENRLD